MKLVGCRHCKFSTAVDTYTDTDGFAQQLGWDDLKRHYQLHHPKVAKAISRHCEVNR